MTETRAKLKRNDSSVLAEDAKRLLNHPVFQAAIAVEENRITADIANGVSDGSLEFEAKERELCRELRTICRIKRRLMGTAGAHDLKQLNKKPETD